jgi:hypothetical protein
LGWEPLLILPRPYCPSQVCAIVDWALLEPELYLQPQAITIEEAAFAAKLAFFAIPVWCTSMTLIKASAVLTMLRLPLTRTSVAVLYSIVAVQGTYWLADVVYAFAKCQPAYLAWSITDRENHCPSERTDILVSSIGSAINITTDIIISIAPMLLFWKLRRPLRERILICGLTGIGLVASFASVHKAVIVGQWANVNDDKWEMSMAIATWTITEQFVSVLAACSPSLKGPIERLLNKFGIALVKDNSDISFVFVPSPTKGEGVAIERERQEQPRGT